ncbi:hypothetical protein GCM10025865_15240 [Paraoerskovia sediminicola]|uniref:Uncharacterized protein n=1 Tax=Paraoerskovia sediminicola TaxID=1138587 RepID=A0ABM8G2K4_9CELL|nr:hypothetical protein GCM10025865_15240 [Paraoerskovia sediminicola]
MRSNRIHGEATLDVVLLAEVDSIELDLVHLRATKVHVGGTRVNYRNVGRKLKVLLGQWYDEGTELQVVVDYEGTPSPRRARAATSAGRSSRTVRSSPPSPTAPRPGSRATTTRRSRRPTRSR